MELRTLPFVGTVQRQHVVHSAKVRKSLPQGRPLLNCRMGVHLPREVLSYRAERENWAEQVQRPIKKRTTELKLYFPVQVPYLTKYHTLGVLKQVSISLQFCKTKVPSLTGQVQEEPPVSLPSCGLWRLVAVLSAARWNSIRSSTGSRGLPVFLCYRFPLRGVPVILTKAPFDKGVGEQARALDFFTKRALFQKKACRGLRTLT